MSHPSSSRSLVSKSNKYSSQAYHVMYTRRSLQRKGYDVSKNTGDVTYDFYANFAVRVDTP